MLKVQRRRPWNEYPDYGSLQADVGHAHQMSGNHVYTSGPAIMIWHWK